MFYSNVVAGYGGTSGKGWVVSITSLKLVFDEKQDLKYPNLRYGLIIVTGLVSLNEIYNNESAGGCWTRSEGKLF